MVVSRVVSHQGGLSSGWLLIWVVSYRVISHQDDWSSWWSFVSHQGGHLYLIRVVICISSGWSFVSHQGGQSHQGGVLYLIKEFFCISSGWSFVPHWGGHLYLIKVVFCISSRSSFVSHQGGLLYLIRLVFCISSGWSFISYLAGLSDLIMVVCHQGFHECVIAVDAYLQCWRLPSFGAHCLQSCAIHIRTPTHPPPPTICLLLLTGVRPCPGGQQHPPLLRQLQLRLTAQRAELGHSVPNRPHTDTSLSIGCQGRPSREVRQTWRQHAVQLVAETGFPRAQEECPGHEADRVVSVKPGVGENMALHASLAAGNACGLFCWPSQFHPVWPTPNLLQA